MIFLDQQATSILIGKQAPKSKLIFCMTLKLLIVGK